MLSETTNETVTGAESFETARRDAASDRETRRKIVGVVNPVEGLVSWWRWAPFDGNLLWTLGDSSERLFWAGLVGSFPRTACTRHSKRLERPWEPVGPQDRNDWKPFKQRT